MDIMQGNPESDHTCDGHLTLLQEDKTIEEENTAVHIDEERLFPTLSPSKRIETPHFGLISRGESDQDQNDVKQEESGESLLFDQQH